MTYAKVEANSIRIVDIESMPDNTLILVVPCQDYSHRSMLPEVISYANITYVITGWNSDRCVAYYKPNGLFASVVK